MGARWLVLFALTACTPGPSNLDAAVGDGGVDEDLAVEDGADDGATDADFLPDLLAPDLSAPGSPTIFVDDSFDTLRTPFWMTGSCPEIYSCTTPEEFAGSSNHVLRVEWRPWDKRGSYDDGHTKGGAEVVEQLNATYRQIFDPTTGTEGWDVRTPGGTPEEGTQWPTFDTDVWYRWRFRVVDATGLDNGNANSTIIGQWHQQNSLGDSFSPVIDVTFNPLDLTTDRFSIVIEQPDDPAYAPGGQTSCTYPWELGVHCQFAPFKMDLPASDRGNWHEVKFHIRWATDNSGYLEFFFDGVQRSVIADVTGTNIPPAYADQARLEGLTTLINGHITYLQLGLYVLGWPSDAPPPATGNIVIDYDDFRAWRE